MNTPDIIKYGNLEVLKAVEGLKGGDWNKIGVTTSWSIKDVISHLASYEALLRDALNSVFYPGEPHPVLDSMNKNGGKVFNNKEVEKRRGLSPEEVLAGYRKNHEQVSGIISGVSPQELGKPGTIPWYGSNYSLEDFIVYANYGHIREHTAQIKTFRRKFDI